MTTLAETFAKLDTQCAPGQEGQQIEDRQIGNVRRGETLKGHPVDFSHGNLEAFPPIKNAEVLWSAGFARGTSQAYTEYRGAAHIRGALAERLEVTTGAPVSAQNELIITSGTQGALFLAMGAVVERGSRVAVVDPDYFCIRKIAQFFGGEVLPVQLAHLEKTDSRGIDILKLERVFSSGVRVFVFANPNNPTGHLYSEQEIAQIAALARRYDITVIVDQLYSRLLYDGKRFTHLCALAERPLDLVTIMGPSKTESLSGFRVGVAFGSAEIVERMERLQSIVSLRAAGYNQIVLDLWLSEPEDWLSKRILAHQAIRDDLLAVFRKAGLEVSTPLAGSYIFPALPRLAVNARHFVQLLREQAGVTVTPGAEFGDTSLDSVRLNFSQHRDAAVSATRRMVELVERYHA